MRETKYYRGYSSICLFSLRHKQRNFPPPPLCLCRNNNDCNWVDSRLYCQDYELKFTPSAAWFGGDVASIVGECACPHGMNWNDYELHCQTNFFSGTTLIIVIVIPLLIGLCCCCACVFLARKMFS